MDEMLQVVWDFYHLALLSLFKLTCSQSHSQNEKRYSVIGCYIVVCGWVIWKGRNAFLFEGTIFLVDKVVDEVKERVWSWGYVKSIGFSSFSNSDCIV